MVRYECVLFGFWILYFRLVGFMVLNVLVEEVAVKGNRTANAES